MDKKIIEEIFEKVKKEKTGGALASYIPELKAQNPDDFGVSIVGDNFSYEIGNSRNPFTVQSVSKVVILALALDENTFEEVEDKISFEPSSNPFNSIKDLEIKNANRPLNPFINAGAIATTSLIKGSYNEKFEKIVNLFEKLSGEEINLNEKVFRSEKKTGDRNRALAYYMKSTSILDLDENIEKLLDVYFKTCSLSVNSYILSKIGYVLSNSGFNQSGEKNPFK
ncbi:glutaminase [Citroniella saccharovorans]|uniref:glutaminase n=1 Tax=Citroniella saccharovorans TaxID=2053367 RepID=A0AAW9MVP6_9FIRM|nr:glutaminase [Citroniella saccharovorans]MEB3428762.1 glutaminase [Citroniella saccharovorans]